MGTFDKAALFIGIFSQACQGTPKLGVGRGCRRVNFRHTNLCSVAEQHTEPCLQVLARKKLVNILMQCRGEGERYLFF